jgi:hypothetical protein
MRRAALCLVVIAAMLAVGCAKETAKTSTQPGTPTPAAKPVATPMATPMATPKATPAAVAPAAGAGNVVDTLESQKDARVMFHQSEEELNGGGSPRLRASNIDGAGAECGIVDFDRAALKASLERNKGKAVTVTLNLNVREVVAGQSGTLQIAALDSASDWNVGDKNQAKADKGEVCAKAAQFGVKAWTTADGKEVATLRDVFWDSGASKPKTMVNENTLAISAADKGKTLSVVLDPKFVQHLATDPKCKGIVLFNGEHGPVLLDLNGRNQQPNGAPTLTVSVK